MSPTMAIQRAIFFTCSSREKPFPSFLSICKFADRICRGRPLCLPWAATGSRPYDKSNTMYCVCTISFSRQLFQKPDQLLLRREIIGCRNLGGFGSLKKRNAYFGSQR